MAASRDQARKLIGSTLLLLLVVIVLLAFVALFHSEAKVSQVDGTVIASIHSKADAERLETVARIAIAQSKAEGERLSLLLNIVFGPVVTLLGSVTGFYFGSNTARRGDQR